MGGAYPEVAAVHTEAGPAVGGNSYQEGVGHIPVVEDVRRLEGAELRKAEAGHHMKHKVVGSIL